MNPRRTFVNGSTPTVLLVHGAFTDGSSWTGVIGELQAAGLAVLAVANPLRGAATDAAYVGSIAADIDGPVLLVGHSYGGAVITRVAAGADNVVGLVFVAAFALDEGESILDVAGRHPDTLLGPALRPTSFPVDDGQPGVDLYLAADRFRDAFGADLPESVTAVARVAQRPIAAVAFSEPAGIASWTTLPSSYVVATADRAIHPEAQRFMARRIRADTIEVEASHSVAVSRPTEVAGHIRAATIVNPAERRP